MPAGRFSITGSAGFTEINITQLIIDYGLTFMSPQVQLQGKDDLKQKLLDFVALLDIIDIGHDAMIKLDCILSTYFIFASTHLKYYL